MRVVYATLLLVAAVGAYALGARGRNSRSGSFEAIRFSIEPPSGYPIRDIAPGLSADGRTLVFLADSAGTTRLFARDLRDLSLSAIAATDGADVASIAVSPDGEWVAYFRDDRLVRVPIERGQQALPVAPSRGFERVGGGTLAWAEDGAILAVPDPAGALLRIDVERNLFDTVRVVRVEAGEFLMSYPTSIAGRTQVARRDRAHEPALDPPEPRRAARRRDGELVRVERRTGHFVVKAWVTEGIRPGVVACSHHMGRWKLDAQGQRQMMATVRLAKQGTTWSLKCEKDVQTFASSDPDTQRLWWTDAGVHQNLAFPVQPDPISGMHIWHQAVRVRRAEPGDRYADIVVDTDKSRVLYDQWLARTRSAAKVSPDGTRRPYWLLRPLKPGREVSLFTSGSNGISRQRLFMACWVHGHGDDGHEVVTRHLLQAQRS